MSFDMDCLEKLVVKGSVVRVLVAGHKGSVPREAGAQMWVMSEECCGTIGGGALELDAQHVARKMLRSEKDQEVAVIPLGPNLGQCCGGSVALVFERFNEQNVPKIAKNQFVRTLKDANKLAGFSRNSQVQVQGKLISEPIKPQNEALWLYGAGHVGREIVRLIDGLPIDVVWVDTSAERFPVDLHKSIKPLISVNPALAVKHAPANAMHLVMTYSHQIDLMICHEILSNPFRFAGLIGSHTKWARFQKRLCELGHSTDTINSITCPIGDVSLGKAPHQIAIGVVAQLLRVLRTDDVQHKLAAQ